MVRGRLPRAAEDRREAVELALIDLATAERVLESRTQLRVVQAIGRDAALEGLLGPALQELAQIREFISEACTQFRSVWDAGQLDRWIMEDEDAEDIER